MAEKPHEVIAGLKRKADQGWPILQHSFRPFFLAAGIWAALAAPIWVAVFAGFPVLADGVDALIWHNHEMLFGFAAAAVCGFILTAIPNWTGALPVSGWRLGLLFVLWLAGRVAFLASAEIGPVATAILDLPFLLVLTLVIGREIIGGKNWRNAPVFIMISLLAAGNGLVHGELISGDDAFIDGHRLAIFILVLLVAVIGGRVIPSFTGTWLKKQGGDDLPASFSRFDRISLAMLVILIAGIFALPGSPLTAAWSVATAIIHGIRLARWRGVLVRSEPLLWIMHVGYGWLVIGLFLIGLSGLVDSVPESAALHALTVGAFGTMILAIMTRASLGHTGRELKAGMGTTAIFLLVQLAALARVATPFAGDSNMTLLWLSATAWSTAFGLFAILYWPVMTRPRVQRRTPSQL